MDRNDKSYFRRPTPEFLESGFNGYKVPENVKERAKLIQKRFAIFGQCDGMYIANCIANVNGSGDGNGTFQDADIDEKNVDRIVKILMTAYKSNIYPEEKADLEEIIRAGTLPEKRMLEGLKTAIRLRKERIQRIRNSRRDYTKAAEIYRRFANAPEHVKTLREADAEADKWRIEFIYGEINILRDVVSGAD